MARVFVWTGILAVGLAVALAAYIRLAPSDPAVWHVDPTEVAPPAFPGHALMRPGGPIESPVLAMDPDAAMAALHAAALAEPRVRVLAGSVDARHVTYVARSAVLGFPDYVSVRMLDAEGGAQPAIFSRLRFGHDDMGVNRARVARWVGAVQGGG